MAIVNIASNNNTRQSPMLLSGQTGGQTIKFITAPRVYIKAPDVTPVPWAVKTLGVLPTGWIDLGIVNGVAKLTYTKSVKEVRTGIENVLRAVYIDKRTANFEADLAQFDDVLIGNLTGLTASVVSAGSIVEYGIGAESVVTKAVLLVATSVLDSKEVLFYNPGAFISLEYSNSGDETSIKMTAEMPLFTWNGNEVAFVQTHCA